jgi:hypothetical protein
LQTRVAAACFALGIAINETIVKKKKTNSNCLYWFGFTNYYPAVAEAYLQIPLICIISRSTNRQIDIGDGQTTVKKIAFVNHFF